MHSIDAVYSLCLDKRQHLIPALEKQVNEYLGMPLNKFWCGSGEDKSITYDRVDTAVPAGVRMDAAGKAHYNAFECHKKIFRKALTLNQTILALEDDSYLIPSRFKKVFFSEKVQEAIDDPKSFDALYLGWWQEKYPGDSSDCNEHEQEWKENEVFGVKRARPQYVNICGLHGVVLSKNFLPKLIVANRGPIDSYINHNLERFKIFYTYPKIIHTLNTYSFCEQLNITHRSVLE
jgi:hypothetical protein